MSVQIRPGQDKDIILRARKKNGDPYDLTNLYTLVACLQYSDGDRHFKYLARTGDISSGSAIVANIDTSDMEIGDPIAGTGIPAGAKVLTIDSSTQLTMDANATATTTALAITLGVVELLTPLEWGKYKIPLTETTSVGLSGSDIETKLITAGRTGYVQYHGAINILDAIC